MSTKIWCHLQAHPHSLLTMPSTVPLQADHHSQPTMPATAHLQAREPKLRHIESVVWVEPTTTSKLLALHNSHIKKKKINTGWTNIPQVCWGDH